MVSLITDFEEATLPVAGSRVHVAVGGTGPPVLLLHGFPETHSTWREVAPELADRFSIVCPDLPGYGDSEPPAGGPASYTKRAMAAAMVELMRQLGHPRFAVVGHDRGALVAFRAALDHPATVTHLGVLDVVPTLDMWESLHGPAGVFAFHLYLLAQPSPFPERLIAADPDRFFGHFFDTWVKRSEGIPAHVRRHYLTKTRNPAVIEAICHDYRASAFVDHEHDEADRDAEQRIAVPTLAMWQDPDGLTLPFDPREVWRNWASDVQTAVVPCGHFLQEEAPTTVVSALRNLLAR